MHIFTSRITVLFEDPFWICLFEREEAGALRACKITFGARPSDAEVYAFLLANHHRLRFSPAVEGGRRPEAKNPKRRQRQVRQATQPQGTGTKAQQALAAARQAGVEQRETHSRAERRAGQQRRFALRSEKRKQKRRGH